MIGYNASQRILNTLNTCTIHVVNLVSHVFCFSLHRYSLIIEDGVVRHMNLEPDDTGLACLLCIQRMKPGYHTDINPKDRHTEHTQIEGH